MNEERTQQINKKSSILPSMVEGFVYFSTKLGKGESWRLNNPVWNYSFFRIDIEKLQVKLAQLLPVDMKSQENCSGFTP